MTIVCCPEYTCAWSGSPKNEDEKQIGEFFCSKDYVILSERKAKISTVCDDYEREAVK